MAPFFRAPATRRRQRSARRHFYSCVPDLGDLGRRSDWRRPRSMYGINQRSIDDQLALLASGSRTSLPAAAIKRSTAARTAVPRSKQVLFGFAPGRHADRPRRQHGRDADGGGKGRLQAGNRLHRALSQRLPARGREKGLLRLVVEPAQVVDVDVIADLGDDDLLFVDFDPCRQTRQRSELSDPRSAAPAAPRRLGAFPRHLFSLRLRARHAPWRSLLSAGKQPPLRLPQRQCALSRRGQPQHGPLCRARRLEAAVPGYQPNDQTDGLGGADGKHFPSSAWLRCIAGPYANRAVIRAATIRRMVHYRAPCARSRSVHRTRYEYSAAGDAGRAPPDVPAARQP